MHFQVYYHHTMYSLHTWTYTNVYIQSICIKSSLTLIWVVSHCLLHVWFHPSLCFYPYKIRTWKKVERKVILLDFGSWNNTQILKKIIKVKKYRLIKTLRWLPTPRVPVFMSLRHNNGDWNSLWNCLIDYHHQVRIQKIFPGGVQPWVRKNPLHKYEK